MSREYVQAKDYRLAGAGVAATDTSITIVSMTLPNSNALVTMADFGDEIGFMTIEPETNREENISFTGITQNLNGTATLTGVTRGLTFVSPSTIDVNLRQSHSGGSIIRVTNSTQFYENLANKYRDETIVNKWTFPSVAGSTRPVIGADTNAVLATELITKGELSRALTSTIVIPTIVTTSSATTGTSTAGSLNWNHVSVGGDRLLLVEISTQEDETVSGVTYNGDALTQAASHTRVTGNLRTEIWYRVAPDLGTNAIVITMSGAAYISATALTLNDVNQTTPIGDTSDADGSSTAPSVVVTTTTDNSLVVDSLSAASDPLTATAGSGQSIQQSVLDTATRQIATSVEIQPTAGNTTMDYTIAPSTNWAITAVEVIGVTGSGGGGTDAFTVGATAADTTPDFLDDKIEIVSSDSSVTVTKTIQNPGANEKISYDLSVLASGGGTKLAIDTTEVTVGNTAVETTLFTVAIPGGTLGTNNAIRFNSIIRSTGMVNTNGETLTIRVKYGATTVSSIVINDPETQFTDLGGSLFGYIIADGATNAQKAGAQIILTDNYGEAINQAAVGISKMQGFAYGTGAEVSTGTLNLVITAQWSDAQVINTITAESIIVEKISTGGGVTTNIGTATKNTADASVVQNIAHGLGTTPSIVKISGKVFGAAEIVCTTDTIYDGVTQVSNHVWAECTGTGGAAGNDFVLTANNGPDYQQGIVTFDATNIIITWTKTGNPSGTAYLIWEASI